MCDVNFEMKRKPRHIYLEAALGAVGREDVDAGRLDACAGEAVQVLVRQIAQLQQTTRQRTLSIGFRTIVQ